jgi:hypothetical protein
MKQLKFLVSLVLILVVRMLPLPANFEPITATIMPYSRRMTMWVSMLLAVLSIFLYDLISGSFGVWSAFTAGSYALLCLFFAWVLKNKANNPMMYVLWGCVGTVLYDVVTALVISSGIYGQGVVEVLVMQVPFTINHLLSTIVTGFLLSPVIDRWLVSGEEISFKVFSQKAQN